MSFNIRNMRSKDGPNGWELRRSLLTDVIRRHAPDVLATQEAYLPQVEYLRQALPEYDGVGAGRDDGKTEGEHCAIFFQKETWQAIASGTFWFADTPDVPGSRQWTPAHARICTWARLRTPSEQTLTVYNVHLDHETQPARAKSIPLALERMRQNVGEPCLLVGDFNMEEDNPAFLAMQNAAPALRDTFRLLHPDAQTVGTFHDFTGRVDGEKIDYIFASEEFDILAAEILRDNAAGRYSSDHFPILARLALPNAATP